jgi:hypothetical protein
VSAKVVKMQSVVAAQSEKDAIEFLREVIAGIESGTIVGLAAVVVKKDRDSLGSFRFNLGFQEFIGALEILKGRALRGALDEYEESNDE